MAILGLTNLLCYCLQCFDAVGWLQEGYLACKKLSGGAGVVVCLGRGADLHMAQLTPLPLTASFFSKIQIGFTFLVPARLTRLLTDKGSLNGCVCVCVCVSVSSLLGPPSPSLLEENL